MDEKERIKKQLIRVLEEMAKEGAKEALFDAIEMEEMTKEIIRIRDDVIKAEVLRVLQCCFDDMDIIREGLELQNKRVLVTEDVKGLLCIMGNVTGIRIVLDGVAEMIVEIGSES